MSTALDFRALMKLERQSMRRARGLPATPSDGGDKGVGADEVVGRDARVGSDTSAGAGAGGAGAGAGVGVGPAARRPFYIEEYPDCTLAPRTRLDLAAFKVTDIPTVYFVPEFVTKEEEKRLLASTYSRASASKWTNLRNRRLQNHGGTPHASGMEPEPLPPFLQATCKALTESGIFAPTRAPNHVLLNEYSPGQGIMPHQDGPLFEPMVAILCLGSSSMLEFWNSLAATKDEATPPVGAVFARRRGLIVFCDDAYQTHWHGIRERESDVLAPWVATGTGCALEPGSVVPRTTRVSLTVRHVLKVQAGKEVIMTPSAQEERRRKELALYHAIRDDRGQDRSAKG